MMLPLAQIKCDPGVEGGDPLDEAVLAPLRRPAVLHQPEWPVDAVNVLFSAIPHRLQQPAGSGCGYLLTCSHLAASKRCCCICSADRCSRNVMQYRTQRVAGKSAWHARFFCAAPVVPFDAWQMISHRTPGVSQDLTSTRWSNLVPQGASNTPPAYS
jgi:hypothetical protein